MPETQTITLCYMVAKQRHEAGQCDAFCSFCYTEAEDYLERQRRKEMESWCVKDFFRSCDCALCERRFPDESAKPQVLDEQV